MRKVVKIWFAIAGAVAVACFVGYLSFRYGLRGSYFALITLAFAEAFHVLARSLISVTEGGRGVQLNLNQDNLLALNIILALLMFGVALDLKPADFRAVARSPRGPLAGVFTIAVIFGAYMTETFRGAILAVSKGQLEAGTAYGMSGFMVFRRITLPQMVRHALPGFGNNWLVLVKTTALVSIIGLDDMVRKAGLAAGATRKPFTFYLVVAINYLLITTISIYILKQLERRYSVGVREF